jgi:hypothetical protein
MSDPYIEIACQRFKSGMWWWASIELPQHCVTSGYARTRGVAVRKLKRELLKIENALNFAKGFLKNQR